MRALSQTEIIEAEWIESESVDSLIVGTADENITATCISVFRGSKCIFEKNFDRSHISIGRSHRTDVVLQDGGVSRRHADIYIENQEIYIFVSPQKKPLLINGRTVRAALVDPDDTIALGPYTLKISLRSEGEQPEFGDDLRYQVVFEGKMKNDHPPDLVTRDLKKWLKHDDQSTSAFISGKPVIIKKDLNLQDAIEIKKAFEKTGAVGQLQAITEPESIDSMPADEQPVSPLINLPDKIPVEGHTAAIAPIFSESLPEPEIIVQPDVAEDDDDEEDEDCEASFSLKQILSTFDTVDQRPTDSESRSGPQLGIFQFLKNSVIDVRLLDCNQNYFIQTSSGRFRLARKDRSDRNYFYFSDDFCGTVRTKQTGSVAISELLTDDNLYHKRKKIYRLALSESDEIIVNNGCHDYLVRCICRSKSPTVAEDTPVKELSWKHGVISLMVHILFLAFLTFLPLAQTKDAPEPETRFVQVDPIMIEKLKEKPKPVVKPPPKKAKPAPKPVKKKQVVKKKPSVRKKSVKAAKKPTKTAKKSRNAVASKHPKAGGGNGKGNTKNRNVNQVGILSMLGDSKGVQVQSAVADVTNLDAVKSAKSGQAKFKVGGIKGKLGTSEISVVGGDVVATKGNSQVLRSYGAGGDGRVAALEKGNVGHGKVKGMVEARLNKSVKIRGGMSREAVKRVIEQHLDEVTYCYETALISNPSIKGKITMEWKILMSGAVGEVRIKSSTIKSPEIYGCIKAAIRTWQFPRPVGNEVIVSYPFIFDIVGF